MVEGNSAWECYEGGTEVLTGRFLFRVSRWGTNCQAGNLLPQCHNEEGVICGSNVQTRSSDIP